MRAIQECEFKTKSFVLRAALHCEPPLLCLNLHDLENGKAYKRDYGEEDIGEQINMKIELEDIFDAFRGEESFTKNKKEHEYEQYALETEIKNSENASFMVKVGGEIKVKILMRGTSKVREYLSELKLEKIRDITEG